MRGPTKLEASEENAGQKNQKTDKQGFEAMGGAARKEEGQLRGRR
jgi:hypothetical protein